MASSKLSTEDIMLSCSICTEKYNQNDHVPKILPCTGHHTVCLTCAIKLTKDQAIRCPSCQQNLQLSVGGAKGLQTNFFIQELQQRLQQLKMGNTALSVDPTGCSKHSNQPLSFFCKACKVKICRDCTIIDHEKSKGHNLEDITVAKDRNKKILQEKIKEITQIVDRKQILLKGYQQQKLKLTKDEKSFMQKADAAYDNMIKQINEQRKLHKNFIKSSLSTASTQIDPRIEKQELDICTLQNVQDFYTKQKAASVTDMVSALGDIHIMSVISNGKAMTPHTRAQDQTNQSQKEEVSDQLQASIQYVTDSFSKMMCIPKVEKMEVQGTPIAGLPLSINIVLDNPVLSELPITVNVIDPYGDVIPSTTSHLDNSHYKVQIRPQISGAHKIEANFIGKILQERNFDINVSHNNPISLVNKGEYEVTDVKFCPSGHMYVASEGKVQVLDINHKYRKIREFQCPAGDNVKKGTTSIAVLDDGTVICPKQIGDDDSIFSILSENIMIFNPTGVIRKQIPLPDKSVVFCIAVNLKQQIIAPDIANHRVYVYNMNGDKLMEIGEVGSGPGQFKDPCGVCIGLDDDIIVGDAGNRRIQVLDQYGQYKYHFGTEGKGKGQFGDDALRVTVDDQGHIIVSDDELNRVQVFEYDGSLVSCIEGGNDPLNKPFGMATSGDFLKWDILQLTGENI